MDRKLWVFVGLVAVILYQAWRVESLRFENNILVQAQRIDESQIRELMWAADNANRNVEGEKTRAFLAGFTQAQMQPKLNEIWHAGYDRGDQVARENARVEVYSEIKDAK